MNPKQPQLRLFNDPRGAAERDCRFRGVASAVLGRDWSTGDCFFLVSGINVHIELCRFYSQDGGTSSSAGKYLQACFTYYIKNRTAAPEVEADARPRCSTIP